jgi:predicted DNA-binding transcriptional regulator AlpA
MTHPTRPQDRTVVSTNQRPTDDDELLTIAEVAAIVRAPVATLRYWRHLGTGPHSFRVGRSVRYWRTDVNAWLQRQCDTDSPHTP